MPAPTLLERPQSTRIVQVLLIYLGASSAILQIADPLMSGPPSPTRALPVAVLLLTGLVIILATAAVPSPPSSVSRRMLVGSQPSGRSHPRTRSTASGPAGSPT